mgnify:CR=1 FL=1
MGWKDDGLEFGPLGLQFLPKAGAAEWDGDGDGDEDHVLVGRGNLKLSMASVSFSVLGGMHAPKECVFILCFSLPLSSQMACNQILLPESSYGP